MLKNCERQFPDIAQNYVERQSAWQTSSGSILSEISFFPFLSFYTWNQIVLMVEMGKGCAVGKPKTEEPQPIAQRDAEDRAR